MINQRVDSRGGRVIGRRAGFSLLEILVVLVILLIGILTILRLFPGGFLTIRRTGEVTSAEALANQMLTGMKNANGLPDSVIAVDAAGNPDFTARPDDMTNFIGANGADWYRSNVNKFRRVLGETIRIPVPTTSDVSGNFGAVALLQYGPVFNRFSNSGGNASDSLSVRGALMERTVVNSGGTFEQTNNIPTLRDGQYAIDYARRRIAFYPRIAAGRTIPNRKFTIRYEYQALVNGQIVVRSVLAGIITVPDVPADPEGRTAPVWQPIFDNDPLYGSNTNGTATPANIYFGNASGNNPTALLPESEDVSRAFRLLTVTPVEMNPTVPPSWSDDPYEYVWYSRQIVDASNQDTNANLGVLIFNPRGYSAAIDTPSGPQPFTARVDYLIFDNHIIRDERQIPSSAPYTVRLSLNNVQQQGDVLNDSTAYNGMFRGWESPTDRGQTPDMIIINANTGLKVGDAFGGSCAPSGVQIYTIDAKSGVVRFDKGEVERLGLQNASVKILYRAQNEWGTQIQKAHDRYVQSDVPTTADPGNGGRPMDYRSYYVGGTVTGKGNPTRVYFPATESGKTIVLGDYYALMADGSTQHFSSESYKTNEDRTLNETLGDIELTWIDVTRTHSNIRSLSPARTGKAVNNVHGGSVKARIVWRDTARWRKLDSETFLTK